jgi:hypothetical protein
VGDELTGERAGRSESEPIHDVVKTALKTAEKLVSDDSLTTAGFLEMLSELPFHDTVNPLDPLLHGKLTTELASGPGRLGAMDAGSGRATDHRAFLRKAPIPFEEQLFAGAATEPAFIRDSCHIVSVVVRY